MFIKSNLFKKSLFLLSLLLLVACEKESMIDNAQKQVVQSASSKTSVETTEKRVEADFGENINKEKKALEIEEIGWDKLIPAGYNPNDVISKYIDQLAKLKDSDPKAMISYGKIQAELDNAPVNMSLDGKTIKMPGFVAPLENNNGVINEFLLVPYFGACIHSPPPPMNQTVLIKADKGQGIKSENSNLPVWITGKLKAVEERTNIGAAGYRIENAIIEPYENDN